MELKVTPMCYKQLAVRHYPSFIFTPYFLQVQRKREITLYFKN